MEEWRKVSRDPNYSVSSLGRVRRDTRANGATPGRILNPCLRQAGYQWVTLSFESGRRGVDVHRLVAEAFIPNDENRSTVNHIDGNKLNNTADNLEWASVSEQHKHAYSVGLRPVGERNPGAKVSDAAITEIVRLASRMTQKEIGELFGISRSHVGGIIRGEKRKYQGRFVREARDGVS